MTLQQHIAKLVKQYGSLRAVAREFEIDAGYLSRLASGEKKDPGDSIIRRLGLQQVVTYKLIRKI